MKDFLKVTLGLVLVYAYGRVQRCIGWTKGVWDHSDYVKRHQEDD